jgi:hypothetical protein
MRKPERPERTEVLSVKVTAADAEAIRAAAARDRMTISEYMRAATLLHMAIGGDGYALKAFGAGAVRLAMGVYDRVRATLQEVRLDMRR